MHIPLGSNNYGVEHNKQAGLLTSSFVGCSHTNQSQGF